MHTRRLRAARPGLIALAVSFSALLSCGNSTSLLSYNVQNLFDELPTGTEYADFGPDSGWNTRAVDRKLEALARVIGSSGWPGPDIVALQEVENAAILHRLARDYLPLSGYQHGIHVQQEDTAVGSGVLSRQRPLRVLVHRPQDVLQRGERLVHAAPLRWILELHMPTRSGTIAMFVVHLKSNRGDASYNRAARRAAADLISIRTRELQRVASAAHAEPDAVASELPYLAVIAGDFNTEDPVALMDSTLVGSSLVGSNAVGAQWQLIADPDASGTYVYQGQWMTYDHILVLPLVPIPEPAPELPREPPATVPPEPPAALSTTVIRQEWMLSHRGWPLRFDVDRLSGYSDHLPVLLRLGRASTRHAP